MTFRVGPETPEIGELLQTTCVVVESDEDASIEEENAEKRRKRQVSEEHNSKFFRSTLSAEKVDGILGRRKKIIRLQ